MNTDVQFHKNKINFCYFVKQVGHFVHIIVNICIFEEVFFFFFILFIFYLKLKDETS